MSDLDAPKPQPREPAGLDAPGRRRLPPLLRQAWYALNQVFRRRIAALGLTPDQFTVLRWLMELDPGPTQRELTRHMCSDPNTIAALLGRMEAMGWIRRVPHETDGRAKRVQLQASGRSLFEACRPLAVELQTQALSALPEGERERFLAQLESVALAIAAHPDASES